MSYSKLIPLGIVSGDEYGYKRPLPVEIEVEIRDTDEGPELSITGSIWRPNRGDIVAGGQCYDEIARAFPYDPRVQRIVEVWKRWHLNGMKAGCEHQRAEGWDKRRIDPSKPANAYGRHFPGQRSDSSNLLGWIRPSEHPDGLLGRECPECGYKYGTAWLHEPLPQEIIEEVQTW